MHAVGVNNILKFRPNTPAMPCCHGFRAALSPAPPRPKCGYVRHFQHRGYHHRLFLWPTCGVWYVAAHYICCVRCRIIYLLLSLACATQARAQLWQWPSAGVNAGVVSAIGNRFQRIGLSVQAYYGYRHLQGNAEVRWYRNFRTPGPRLPHNELVTAAGVVYAWGPPPLWKDPFISVTGNQTGHRNSVGYSYNYYWNRIGTRQQTGIISVQIDRFGLISENDLFARPTLDRFRTGAVLLQYRYRAVAQLALNCTMWTGQMGTNKITGDPSFPHYGYMDTTGGRYTRFSHGLLSAQGKVHLGAGQVAQANAGIDAEQVRNALQNRLFHDMVFIPRRWRQPKNCHIPMLDTAGNPYLYRPGQHIKKATPYWNVFTAPFVFY